MFNSLTTFKLMKHFQKSLCNVMSHVLFANPIKLNISTENTVTKILPKKLYRDFKRSLQFNQENTGQNFVS